MASQGQEDGSVPLLDKASAAGASHREALEEKMHRAQERMHEKLEAGRAQLQDFQQFVDESLQERAADEEANAARAEQKDGTHWDWCMVFELGSAEKRIKIGHQRWVEATWFASKAASWIEKMHVAGLKTTLFKSMDGRQVFCLIGAPLQRLLVEAERTAYDLPLDPQGCFEISHRLGMRLAKRTLSDEPACAHITMNSWEHMFAPFRADRHRDPAFKGLYTTPLLRTTDRLKLTLEILEAEPFLGGAHLCPFDAVGDSHHPLAHFYSLHEYKPLLAIDAAFREQPIHRSVFQQPVRAVRDYMGEAVGFYFGFLQFYSRWLVVPALIGFCLWVAQLATGDVDVPVFTPSDSELSY